LRHMVVVLNQKEDKLLTEKLFSQMHALFTQVPEREQRNLE